LNKIPKKRGYGFGELLRWLKRVEYIEVVCLGQEKAFWYLNLTEVMRDQLKAISPENNEWFECKSVWRLGEHGGDGTREDPGSTQRL